MSSIDSLVGTVLNVDDVPAGDTATADHPAGATVLHLVDAGDFSEEGGLADVAGTVVAYTSADLSTDTLTLAEPLPVPVAEDMEVHVSPPAVSRVAVLRLDDANTLDARVPQSLLDQVPVGLRGDDAETVTADLVDGQWQLVDLVAVPSRAMDRGAVEQIVMDTADGLTQHSMRLVDAAPAPLPDPPTTEGRAEGDTHHDLTSGTGVVRAAYVLSGDGQWVPHRFGDEVLDSVAAGKILGGVITALLRIETQGALVVGDEGGVHVRIENGRIDVMTPTQAGPVAFISMGRDASGAFRVLDEDGGVLGGINSDASIDTPMLRADDIEVDGEPIRALSARRWQDEGSLVMPAGAYGPYTGDMPLVGITTEMLTHGRARLDVQGWTRGTGGEQFNIRATYTRSTDGSMPPTPSNSSPSLPGAYAPCTHSVTNRWESRQWSWEFGEWANARYRILIWLEPVGASSGLQAAQWSFSLAKAATHGLVLPGQVYAEVNPGGGGSTPPPPTGPPPLETIRRTFDLTGHASWYHTGVREGGQYGQYVTVGNIASIGARARAFLSVPSAARAFAQSAEELVDARVRLSAAETPYSSWQVRFGTSGRADISSGEPPFGNVGPGSKTYSKNSPSGWSTLAQTTLPGLKAGQPTIALDYPSSGTPYLRFHGTGARSSLRPKLELIVRTRT